MFVDCVLDNEYEISIVYPHAIRNKRTGKIVAECMTNDGHINVNLNGHTYGKHVVIATQWIHNDDPINKTQVDHKNKHGDDNRIENLRWVTPSTNCKNRTGNKGIEYEFIDEPPDDAILVEDYGRHQFEDYFYSPSMDRFIFWTGVDYRLLHINYKRSGAAFANAYDVDDVQVKIYYSKFKRIYGFD